MSQNESDTESILTDSCLDIEGLELIDPLFNTSLFTVTSQNKNKHMVINIDSDSDSETGSITHSLRTIVTSQSMNMSSENSSGDGHFTPTGEEESLDTIHAVMMRKYKKSLLQWDDFYEGVTMDEIPECEKSESLVDLKELLNNLQEVELHYEEHPYDAFTVAARTKLLAVRQKAAKLLRALRAAIKSTQDNRQQISGLPKPNIQSQTLDL